MSVKTTVDTQPTLRYYSVIPLRNEQGPFLAFALIDTLRCCGQPFVLNACIFLLTDEINMLWLFGLFLLLNKLVPFQPMGSSLCPAGSPSGIVINSSITDWAFSLRQSPGPDSFTMIGERILTNIHYGHIGQIS